MTTFRVMSPRVARLKEKRRRQAAKRIRADAPKGAVGIYKRCHRALHAPLALVEGTSVLAYFGTDADRMEHVSDAADAAIELLENDGYRAVKQALASRNPLKGSDSVLGPNPFKAPTAYAIIIHLRF